MSEDDDTPFPVRGLLIKLLDIRDPERLDTALNDYACIAWAELLKADAPKRPDFEYLRYIQI